MAPPKHTCWDFHWCFTPIFDCSKTNGKNNRTYIRWLTNPEQKSPATQLWVQINRLRTGVGRFWPLLQFASGAQQIKSLTIFSSNVQSINLPMDCTAWRSGWWDNRLAAQHLSWDLVRPSSGLNKLAQTMMMKQLVLAYCRHSNLNQPHCAAF